MNRKNIFLNTVLLLLSLSVWAQDNRPNIILILADDLGYSDLGSYGSEIPTPNLDRLAKEGLRLREFYNNSICAPTRASLLTGQYQHKAGVGYFSNDLGLPAYQGYLNKESLTIAEVLKENGYITLTSGKWHVSGKGQSYPWERGFDYVYPRDDKNANSGAPGLRTPETDAEGYPTQATFSTNLITRNAIGFLDSIKSRQEPFFLYLAHTAPHWPLVAPKEDIARFEGKYDMGWSVLREQRLKRQREIGLIPTGLTPSTADRDLYDWEKLTAEQRAGWAKKMEIFAAMVYRLDQSIGELLDRLEKNGQLDNTLIVFLSDNGAPAEDLVRWHHGSDRNKGAIGTVTSYESQSKNWSYASNTPFKAFKDYMYEGGINTPFIAWFPGRIQQGEIKQGTGHIIDLAPTFYELANAKYPEAYKATKVNALVGKSLLPLLTSESQQVLRKEGLFWERAGNRAARVGKWKLVSTWPSQTWELYDLESDPTETRNIADKNEEVVSRLAQAYANWAKETGVVDFAELESKEPASMKEFRKSKVQEVE